MMEYLHAFMDRHLRLRRVLQATRAAMRVVVGIVVTAIAVGISLGLSVFLVSLLVAATLPPLVLELIDGPGTAIRLSVTIGALGAVGGLLWQAWRIERLEVDRRPRRIAARDLTAQAVVAHAIGGTVFRLELGTVTGGCLGWSSVCTVGELDAQRMRFDELTVSLANPSLAQRSWAWWPAHDQRRAWIRHISALAEDVTVSRALDQHVAVDRGAVITQAANRAQQILLSVPYPVLQQIEDELVKGGLVRGTRFIRLLTPPQRKPMPDHFVLAREESTA